MISRRSVRTILSAIAVLIYAAVRLWRLDASCLWFDEIFSVHAAEHSWLGLLQFAALDLVHPPLFYAVLKLWINIGGEGVYWLRLLPVLFSIAAIVPLKLLLNELGKAFPEEEPMSPWVGVVTLIALAVNGPLIKYAQELRMYSMLMFLGSVSMWLFARYFYRGLSLLPLVLVNILVVYTHYFGWFLLTAELVVLVTMRRERSARFAAGVAASVLAFAPWASAVVAASRQSVGLVQNIGWTPRPGLADIARLLLAAVEPFYYPATTVDRTSDYLVALPVLAIASVAVLLAFLAHRRQHGLLKLASLFIVMQVVGVFAASWVSPQSVWGVRHLTMVFPPVALLVGCSLTGAGNRTFKTSAMALLLLFFGWAFVRSVPRNETPYIWCCWEKLSAETGGESRTMYATEDLVAYHLWFATRGDQNVQVRVLKGVDGAVEDPGFFMPRGFDEIPGADLSQLNDESFWLALRAKDIRESPQFYSVLRRGYRVAETHDIASLGENGYLIKLVRER